MNEDAERDTDNPGPFEAQTELGSVCTSRSWYSLALEEVARLRDREHATTKRLEARVRELEEVLGPFAGSPLNDPRYERYIVQDPPLSTVGVKRVDFFRAAAALKGGDAE